MKKDRTLGANLLDALAKAKGASTKLAVPKYWGTENVQWSTFGTRKNKPNRSLFYYSYNFSSGPAKTLAQLDMFE